MLSSGLYCRSYHKALRQNYFSATFTKIIYIENCKVGTNHYFAVTGTGHGTGSSNRDNPVQNGTSGHPNYLDLYR